MKRLLTSVIAAVLISLPLWGGGCGSATGGSEFGNPGLTGILPAGSPSALEVSRAQTSACSGISRVRAVCGEASQSFDVAGDCSFSITLQPVVYCYVQFLNAGGGVSALLSWPDPTQPAGETPERLTSFIKMGREQTHSLGHITLKIPMALPEFPPIGFDTDGNGIADDEEDGFQTGTDTDGDGIPEIFTPPSPGTGGTGDITTPFTPAVGQIYGPQTTGCGFGTTMKLESASETEVVLNPLGSNGPTVFVPNPAAPDTAQSQSKDLTVFEVQGYSCEVQILTDLSLDVTCATALGGSCKETFRPL